MMRSKLRQIWNQRRRKGKGKYLIFHGSQKNYITSGAWMLEQSISMFHGKANPIRHVSVDDLNSMKVEVFPCHNELHYNLYRGTWEGRTVLVKKPCDDHYRNNYFLEIVVATQMAAHNNANKLLACCLETKKPVLVYDWVEPQTLSDKIVALEWEDRLRIAWEISHATAYLHTAFPRPIIHRELTARNVFLNQDNCAKICDFSLCVSIPEGEEFVQEQYEEYDEYDSDTIISSSGRRTYHKATEHVSFGKISPSSDVYSFGRLLLTLLRGRYLVVCMFLSGMYVDIRDYFSNNKLVDTDITRYGISSIKRLQLETCIKLALHCVARKEDQRPSMVDVATVLKNIITSPESILDTTSFKIEHDIGVLFDRACNIFIADFDTDADADADWNNVDSHLYEIQEDMRKSLERSINFR